MTTAELHEYVRLAHKFHSFLQDQLPEHELVRAVALAGAFAASVLDNEALIQEMRS